MIAKVSDTLIHEACIVKKHTKLIDAIDKSMKYKTSTIIIEGDNKEYGIITDSLLKVKVLLEGRDLSIPVSDIAIFFTWLVTEWMIWENGAVLTDGTQ